jgi:hypothetical protein
MTHPMLAEASTAALLPAAGHPGLSVCSLAVRPRRAARLREQDDVLLSGVADLQTAMPHMHDRQRNDTCNAKLSSLKECPALFERGNDAAWL